MATSTLTQLRNYDVKLYFDLLFYTPLEKSVESVSLKILIVHINFCSKPATLSRPFLFHLMMAMLNDMTHIDEKLS